MALKQYRSETTKKVELFREIETAIKETQKLTAGSLKELSDLSSDLTRFDLSLNDKIKGRKLVTFKRGSFKGTSKTGRGGKVLVSYDEQKLNGVSVFVRDKYNESPKKFLKLLKTTAELFIKKFKEKYLSGKGKDSVNYVTGRLYRSLKSDTPKKIGENEKYSEYTVPIYFNKAIAKQSINQVGEYGKIITVRPKNGAFLAIPLNPSVQKKFKLNEGESLYKYKSSLKMKSFFENGHYVPYLVSGNKKMFRLTKKPIKRKIVVDLKKGERELLTKIKQEVFGNISEYSLGQIGKSQVGKTKEGEPFEFFQIATGTDNAILHKIPKRLNETRAKTLQNVSNIKYRMEKGKFGLFESALFKKRFKGGNYQQNKKAVVSGKYKKLKVYKNKALEDSGVPIKHSGQSGIKKRRTRVQYFKSRAIESEKIGKRVFNRFTKEQKSRFERKLGTNYLKHALLNISNTDTNVLMERVKAGKIKKINLSSKDRRSISYVDIRTKQGNALLKEAEILSGKSKRQWEQEKVILSSGREVTRKESQRIAAGKAQGNKDFREIQKNVFKEKEKVETKNIVVTIKKGKTIEMSDEELLRSAEKSAKKVEEKLISTSGQITKKKKAKLNATKQRIIEEYKDLSTEERISYLKFSSPKKRAFLMKYFGKKR